MTALERCIFQPALLMSTSALVGLGLNAVRPQPLPLWHLSAREKSLASPGRSGEQAVKWIGFAEMAGWSQRADALIFDVRPGLFYEAGHIPQALSLPKEELFIERSAKLMSSGLARRQEVIVYCSGSDCEDSIFVAEKLMAFGFRDVLIYEGGWDEWVERKGSQK